MPRRNFVLPSLAFIGVVLFFCLLTRLMLLRYERGDVYPPYSTLRADPLGARAFYEALESIPGYTVTRGFNFLDRELQDKPGTLVYLGMDASDVSALPKDDVAELDDFVKNGGRVVIAFSPEKAEKTFAEEVADAKKKKAEPAAKDDKDKPPDKPADVRKEDATPDEKVAGPQTEEEKYEREEMRKERAAAEKLNDGSERAFKYKATLTAVWGFGWDQHSDNEDKDKDKGKPAKPENYFVTDANGKPEVFAHRATSSDLEESVPWKSAIYFVRLESDWTTLYDAKAKPVAVWRKWGKGEIIIATDSYLISNEALRNDRRPILLNLLAGPPGHVLFDETHLGTEEQQGVMFLLEKFRLEGYLFGLLAVLALFLWRNSVPLVPPQAPGSHAVLGGTISGKDSRSGLVNLLRRNIPSADIVRTSLAEWKRSVLPTQRHQQEKTAAMDAALAASPARRADDIVLLYHQLRELNNPSRAPHTHATKS
jgi:Domain of unknown function (DUF4350)